MNIHLHSRDIVAELNLPDGSLMHPKPESASATDNALTDAAFLKPLGLPQLSRCVVPGDRVCVVIDPETPEVIRLIELVYQQFQDTVAAELDLTLLLPEDHSGQQWSWLTDALTDALKSNMAVKIHDPKDDQQATYLASTAGGQRIYLNPAVNDADLIITVGALTWDPKHGIKGTSSGFFPALSNSETLAESQRLSHIELNPAERNPRRDVIDEIGWLAGTQFTVQVIPGCDGRAERLLCGAPDAVMNEGREILMTQKQIGKNLETDLLILTVAEVNGRISWKSFGQAVAVACQIVSDETRIAVIADLPAEAGPACQMLQRCDEPNDLIKPLTLEPTYDATETIQLIQALNDATVFLLSNLPSEQVEDLGLLPLENTSELQRLVDQVEKVAVLRGANFLASTSG